MIRLTHVNIRRGTVTSREPNELIGLAQKGSRVKGYSFLTWPYVKRSTGIKDGPKSSKGMDKERGNSVSRLFAISKPTARQAHGMQVNEAGES